MADDELARLRAENRELSRRVTELETSLRHAQVAPDAQKLSAIGQLAAGIAHNFNNLLAGLIPTLDLLAPAVPAHLADLVGDATHAAKRASELVRQLMAFAGQRRGTTRNDKEVGELVAAAVGICQRTFERHIRLEVEVEPGLPLVHCDAGGLEQVLLNLLLNAKDAVLERDPADATIRIEARRVGGPAPGLEADKAYVVVRVSDNGQGVPPAVRARLFEPFFTTKPQGRGTGLGLATSFAVVRDHGGTITCEERPDGAAFLVYLPAAPPATASASPAPAEAMAARSLHVLIADDEELVRRVVRRALEAEGHVVTTAASGAEAMACISRTPGLDVVLLDRSLGDAPGERLVPELRRRAPQAKIVLFTGLPVEPELERQVDAVLLKPVRPEQLRRAIMDAVERPRGLSQPF